MRTRIGSLLFLFCLSGCSIATIAQLRKPQPADAPAAKSFPEAEQLLPAAARSNAGLGTIERAYITDSRWLSGSSERAVGVMVFTSRKGGALVKDEHGSPDQVCFRHACALAQDRVGGGYGPAYVQCIDGAMLKVTCDSVEALPPGVAL